VSVTINEVIDLLPIQLYPDDITPTPVMRDWVSQLPLRHQGVLVTAIRGCDGAPKDDPSKALSCSIRRAIMNPADYRETTYERGFFGFSASRMKKDIEQFLHSLDQYPLHYVTHLMHASEIIGYKHPNRNVCMFFNLVYRAMVKKFHLLPEQEGSLDERLTLDRIEAGTVERDAY
jgi:hypothetical protein